VLQVTLFIASIEKTKLLIIKSNRTITTLSEQELELLQKVTSELNDIEERLNGSFVIENGVLIFRRWSDDTRVPMDDIVSGLS